MDVNLSIAQGFTITVMQKLKQSGKVSDSSGVNFMNILHATFLQIFWHQKIAKTNIIRQKLLNLLSYEKHSYIIVMELKVVSGQF